MKVLLSIIALFFSYQGLCETCYIDHQTKIDDEARNTYLEELKKENEYQCSLNSYICLDKYLTKSLIKYPLRGGNYAKKNYSSLTTEQGFEKLAELAKIYQQAKDKKLCVKEPGLIDKNSMLEEAWYIFKNILKFNPRHSKWDYFKSDSLNRNILIPTPFIDKQCNSILQKYREMQSRINKTCPE